ncbi:MAG: FeoB-associated Cys-rich membrane protein [Clostridiaceae bacterium]|nr:FeoB-associated Cys-rich membrane protein [Clostridiaceae bacterium]
MIQIFDFLIANAATLVVGLTLAAVMIGIIYGIYRNKKAGKSSCGGNCSGCPSCTACHGQKR